ncbi:uncharacterized protein LOC128919717 [Zeugodacus cucurbitae]|uniref:uncharacterized protein LOC128919717 n=1 Tax=Zeugodacus cucurbitae TaxID=28588 RepID=UPI000596A2C7|nr:uncharacterized protein LOC128919717 [Zeugodacus cucurbitae]
MAGVSNNKYFAAFILLIGVACSHADDTRISKTDIESFISLNQLLGSILNDSHQLSLYVYEKSGELCRKILDDDDTYNLESSEQFESGETVMSNCVNHVVNRFDPTESRDDLNEILLRKYGFEDIRKLVDQKYDEFYKEIVWRIDEYLFGLTVEQQGKATAQNLRMWTGRIQFARTLSQKEMVYRACARYFYFMEECEL